MNKTYYTAAELAALKLPEYPATRQNWNNLVVRESWKFIEVQAKGGKGGIRREYLPPEHVAKLIAQHQRIQVDGAESRQVMQARNLARAEEQAHQARRTAVTIDQLMGQLTPEGQALFDAKYDVLMTWRDWLAEQKAQQPNLGKKAAFKQFSDAWNAGQIKECDAGRKKYPTISPRSIERWVSEHQKNGLMPVVDKRAVKGNGGKSIFKKIPALEKMLIGMLIENPSIQTTHLTDLINHARKDFETGEVLFDAVNYDAVLRYRNRFEQENGQALLAIKNPDAWKSKYLSSLGKADGDVHRLNQLWEMDGTPADWELVGGRYNASVVIDVFGRRPMIQFSKTPNTETNKQLLRTAVLAWGVPEAVGTDNGTDYKSREMRLFLDEMGIDHRICDPFSPWQKPHVESFIKTYLHGMLEVLPQFWGHSVAERSELEARQTFADQLFKKNDVVKLALTVEELQDLTNKWIAGCYMQNKHSSLGMTPFERVASSTAPVRRVENERALDILLAQPTGKRPTISAKGIRFENAWFIHAELPLHAGKAADIRLDPNDLGRLYVRVDGQFLCIAECPERTGINRAEVAAHGRALQKKTISEAKANLKKAKKALPMSTGDLVKDLVMTRAERAGKLVHIERAEEYRSAGLDEAAKAVKAGDAPQPSSNYEILMAEARAAVEAGHAINAEADRVAGEATREMGGNVVAHPSGIVAFADIQGMTHAQMFDYWLELDAIKRARQPLKSEHHEGWYRSFPGSNAYKYQDSLRKSLSEAQKEGGLEVAATTTRPI